MAKGMTKTIICLLCVLLVVPLLTISGFAAEEPVLITDFNSLMTAVRDAKDGDTLLVGDIDFSPLSPDVPNSMMSITIEKSLTIKSGKADGAAVFLNGGFVLSGSKLSGEKITVNFENIIFDGKADYDNLTEKDYEHPWSEAEQVYTYNASLKAQQALSFIGNVDADFSGCVFRNYMHEYGPVIDIRYADYTGNDYVTLPDYSGCSLNLHFDNCRIERNTALFDGGAIYIEANNNVVLNAEGCVFVGNRSKVGNFSRGGGAIWAQGVALNFTDCTLEKNTANHAFSDSVLSEYDTQKGGVLYLEASKLSMVNCTIQENQASIGGAISMTNTQADIDGCRFTSNRAEYNATNPDGVTGPWSNMGMGGALYMEGNSNDTVLLVNCEIKDNFAVNAYGGIYGYYVPFEDPSFGTYIIKMILCTYEGNRDGVDYDYSTVGDLAWMSHPGDMFANPHMTLFGCYITDETFEKNFPRNDSPTGENGYNYMSATENEEACRSAIPAAELQALLGDRYGDKLTEYHVGSNYAESLYKEEEETDPPSTETDPPSTETDPPSTETDPQKTGTDKPQNSLLWWLLGDAVILIIVGVVLFVIYRKKKNTATPDPVIASVSVSEQGDDAIDEAVAPSEKQTIIKTRYDDDEIDRFISLVPEVGTLTTRELEVLREILRGKKQSEVAYFLGIGVSTVKDFYKKIYAKLDVENKDGLLLKVSEVLRK